MELQPLDIALTWAEFFTRWLHVVAGVAWIGSSFYFVALDLSLKPRDGLPEGANGEAWQVHGGGFYHMVKYLVAPAQMPDELTWFKWEAYTTWLSGVGLMILIYFFSAELYLIDRSILDIDPLPAAGLSIGVLVLGWAAYDGLCRSPLGKNDLALMLVGFAFLIAVAYGLTLLFSARAAFMLFGALIGTIMVANVLMVIIPGQRKVVAALLAGATPDPEHGRRGKQRSLHNNYLTLPVIYVMIGGHYPLAFATQWTWAMLAIVVIMGVSMRHFFNTKHKGEPWPWWTWGVTALGGLALIWLSMSGPRWVDEASADGVETFLAEFDSAEEAVEEIVISRCSMCHAAEPVWEGVPIAPKAVRFDEIEEIRLQAKPIVEQAAWSHAMPPGNVTAMSDDERRVLAAWYADGAQ